ncbi:MAG: hypothetical protein N2235_15845 [Fischerella sp.]|nr:hypothetical protein [Fischerella sp.]
MIKLARELFAVITLPLCTVSSLAPMTVAKAQVTPDHTLGTENSALHNQNMNEGESSWNADVVVQAISAIRESRNN